MRGLSVNVLGSSGGYAVPGRACSGFLLGCGADSLLIDIGAGALANLLGCVSVDSAPPVIISHLHYDHYVDVYGLYVARRYYGTPLEPLTVWVPPGGRQFLSEYFSLSAGSSFQGVMVFHEMVDGGVFSEGEFSNIRAVRVVHNRDSYALRLECAGTTLAYSSDTGLCDSLVEVARDVNLFICEATFGDLIGVSGEYHLSAREAGEIATEAGAGRLVLTHIWPTLDPQRALRAAEETFDGEVILAEEGLTIDV